MNKNKTYKLQLQKDVNVDKAHLRIHDGHIVVDVELEDEIKPKDGDFLVSASGAVFIYSDSKPSKDGLYSSYVGEFINKQSGIYTSFISVWYNKKYCRFATPEEKSAFLSRLENELGKKWNPDTKELDDIRWRADKDCTYYYVDERGNVLGCNDTRGCASDSRYSCGNYFKTREAARPYSDQIKEIFKKSKAE